MKKKRSILCLIIILSLVSLAGCGVPKNRYEALLKEKKALEDRVAHLETAKTVIKDEYEKLLAEKMDLAVKLEILFGEKKALKDEYDKLLSEKLAIKAAYDRLIPGNEN